MPFVNLPYPPTNWNAPRNARELAKLILSHPHARVIGRSPAGGLGCFQCGRHPPSGDLFEIVLDPVANIVVRVGIGRCHGNHLADALRDLIREEQAGSHPNRQNRINHLTSVLRQLV